MTVRVHEEPSILGQDELPFRCDRWEHTLDEEVHITLIKTEVPVLLEVFPRSHVVFPGGHDEPWDGALEFLFEGEDLFSKKAEQTFALYRRYPHDALGCIDPQTRALTSCNNECRDLAGLQKLLAAIDIWLRLF